jgi:membrane protein DedA with SNARE-associated domain
VIVAGVVGALCGALIAYGLAARWGTQVLLGPGRWVGFRPRHLELADRWFANYGRWAVLAGRCVPVVRGYVSFPAGLTGFPLVLFGVLTLSGSLPWVAGWAVIGYLLGFHFERFSGPVGIAAAGIIREQRAPEERS